jgi:hypothetical protein
MAASAADPVPVQPPPPALTTQLSQREPSFRILDVLLAWRATGQVYPI